MPSIWDAYYAEVADHVHKTGDWEYANDKIRNPPELTGKPVSDDMKNRAPGRIRNHLLQMPRDAGLRRVDHAEWVRVVIEPLVECDEDRATLRALLDGDNLELQQSIRCEGKKYRGKRPFVSAKLNEKWCHRDHQAFQPYFHKIGACSEAITNVKKRKADRQHERARKGKLMRRTKADAILREAIEVIADQLYKTPLEFYQTKQMRDKILRTIIAAVMICSGRRMDEVYNDHPVSESDNPAFLKWELVKGEDVKHIPSLYPGPAEHMIKAIEFIRANTPDKINLERHYEAMVEFTGVKELKYHSNIRGMYMTYCVLQRDRLGYNKRWTVDELKREILGHLTPGEYRTYETYRIMSDDEVDEEESKESGSEQSEQSDQEGEVNLGHSAGTVHTAEGDIQIQAVV